MSFLTKKTAAKAVPDPVPAVPAQQVAPVVTPQTGRQKRLATGGRQSTFLSGLFTPQLPTPTASLTGVGKGG